MALRIKYATTFKLSVLFGSKPFFHANMQTRCCSTASARAKGENAPPPLAGNASELVKVVCHVMISELREEVQPKQKLVREDVGEVRTSTTKLLDHTSVCMDITEITIPSAVVTDEAAELRTEINVLMEGHNALSNAMGLRFSKVAERLAQLKQKNDTGFTPAPVRKERRKPAKKNVYPSNTNSALSR